MALANEVPQLEQPQPLRARNSSHVASALLLIALAGAGGFVALDSGTSESSGSPWRPEQLSANVVTPVRPDDRIGVKSAVAALKVSGPQRAEIEKTVLDGSRRIGWIVFTDSIDADGDTISVEASGLTQQVVLTKAWTPVAVLLDGSPIKVTAVRDGESGGITIGFATNAGTMPMRILSPGEQIEVVP